jgi:hypothetical protein
VAQHIQRGERNIGYRRVIMLPRVEVTIVDTSTPQHGFPYALLARGSADLNPFENAEYPERWVVGAVSAVKGYGPLLYDLLARAVGADLHASVDLGPHSRRFWRKQERSVITPLSTAQFRAKYGAAVPREVDLPPEYLKYAEKRHGYAWAEEERLPSPY